MNASGVLACELDSEQFAKVSHLVYRIAGIKLRPGKEGLVKARLMKRLNALGLDTFEAYLDYLEHEPSRQELSTMIDVLTTNKTSFFREHQHFDYFRQYIVPELQASRQPVRLWSAGCSTGQESYSLAITLRETMPDLDRRDVRILATDLSTQVLQQARQAVYEEDILADVPQALRRKYFVLVRQAPIPAYEVIDKVRRLVQFARLNLMQQWPMRGPFDLILCRNVMIYFDKPTQERLVNRFWQLLRPGGHLFIGHSESLSGVSHPYHYIQPAIYVK
jgi:chemotaxis protein methyltransferase CheR